jgi:hypothetical protein
MSSESPAVKQRNSYVLLIFSARTGFFWHALSAILNLSVIVVPLLSSNIFEMQGKESWVEKFCWLITM